MNNIEQALLEFFEAAESPVLFCGAGVSAVAGLPTWDRYLTQLAEFARPHDHMTRHIMLESIQKGRLDLAAGYYFMCRDIPESEKYNNIVHPLAEYRADALEPLMALPFAAVVTTNFDRALLDAYASAVGRAPREVNLGDPTLSAAQFERSHFIARINGRVEVPQTMVLTELEFEKLLANPSYTDFVTHVLTRHQVLFLGFSFVDPAIRAIMEIVRSRIGPLHDGKHLALVPDDAAGEFTDALERYSVKRMSYSANKEHSELWEAVATIAEQMRGTKAANPSPHDPFGAARKYLAACYARSRSADRLSSLREAVSEGVVSSFIKSRGAEGVLEKEVSEFLRGELFLDEQEAEILSKNCIQSLRSESLCLSDRSDPTRFVWAGDGGAGTYEDALGELVSSAINRYKVREAGIDSEVNRECLREFFRDLVLKRGWDLGAAFASHEVPEAIDVLEMMMRVEAFERLDNVHSRGGLARACTDILSKPNEREAHILADLGRLSFGLELVFQSPRDALFHGLTLPQKIYLDANVLMPAITPGHPFQPLYQDTIDRLVEASRRSKGSVEVAVFYGFLNEVVSHRRLAIQEVGWRGGLTPDELVKEVHAYGPENVNVFVGAFAHHYKMDESLTFRKFLKMSAPYEDEKSLSDWLKQRGIAVIGDIPLTGQGSQYPDILHVLERAYSNKLSYAGKSAQLVQHDAVQLAGLHKSLRAGMRTVFVTADRSLRAAIEDGAFAHLGNSMVSHVGLIQLVDLLVGGAPSSKAFSKLIWGANFSSNTEAVRNYLVDLALNEYDAALAMSLNKVVDAVASDIGEELDAQHLSLLGGDGKGRRNAVSVIGEFEERFYDLMRKAIEDEEMRHST